MSDQESYLRGEAAARAMLGKDNPRAAMTDRQREITDHPHGRGRHRELAAHLAHKTSVSAETAVATMDAAERDAEREDRVRGEK